MYEERLSEMREVNSVVSGGTVMFGSSTFARIPFSEIASALGISVTVYNRSLKGLTAEKAAEVLKDCVLDLNPDKVFVNLGETEMGEKDFDPEKTVEDIRRVLSKISAGSGAKIYLVSVMKNGKNAEALNERIEELAKETGYRFVDTRNVSELKNPMFHLVSELRTFMRTSPIRFADAMQA